MDQKAQGAVLRASGWVFLIFSWALISALVVFCFYKIFTKKKVD